MNGKQSQYVAVGVVGSLALVAGTWFFGVSPNLADYKDQKAAAQILVDESAKDQVQLSALQQAQNDIEELVAKHEGVAAQFPASFQSRQWVTMVAAAASRSGITLNEVSVTPPAYGANPDAVDPAAQAAAQAAEAESTSLQPGVPDTADPDSEVSEPGDEKALGAAQKAQQPSIQDQESAIALGQQVVSSSKISINAGGDIGAARTFLNELARMNYPLLIDTFTVGSGEGDDDSVITITGRVLMLRPLVDPTEPPAEDQEPASVDVDAPDDAEEPASSPDE